MWFQKPPLGTPLDWGNPLNDETVLALAMNEGNGDKVQDLSLNGNHGTLKNFAFPPTVASGWNPGQNGIGLRYNGTNTYIDCGDKATLNVTGPFTVSAIINPSTIPDDYGTIMGSRHTWDDNIWFTVKKTTMKICVRLETIHNTDFCGNTALSPGEWYNAVFTYDLSDLKIYLNGSLDGEKPLSGAAGSRGSELNIGGITTTYSFIGFIDQPRIMNRAWTAKEVRDYAINPWQVYLDE